MLRVWFLAIIIKQGSQESSHNLLAGRWSWLPFVKNATPVKHTKAKHNKTKQWSSTLLVGITWEFWKRGPPGLPLQLFGLKGFSWNSGGVPSFLGFKLDLTSSENRVGLLLPLPCNAVKQADLMFAQGWGWPAQRNKGRSGGNIQSYKVRHSGRPAWILQKVDITTGRKRGENYFKLK